MVPVAVAGNISREATTPSGNIFAEATRGVSLIDRLEQSDRLLAQLRQPGAADVDPAIQQAPVLPVQRQMLGGL